MIRTTPLKIAAATGALVLGGAVAAAAVTTPDAADDGLTNASERTGFELPASQENHPTGEDHPGGGPEEADDIESLEEEELEPEEQLHGEGERPENHGFVVSELATNSELTGRERGQAIADVAQSDAGKPDQAGGPEDEQVEPTQHQAPPVETPNDGGTGTADQASGGASEAGTSQAADQAAQGSGNADPAGDGL